MVFYFDDTSIYFKCNNNYSLNVIASIADDSCKFYQFFTILDLDKNIAMVYNTSAEKTKFIEKLESFIMSKGVNLNYFMDN